MILHLTIRTKCISCVLFLCCIVLSAQGETEKNTTQSLTENNFFSSEDRQKLFSIMVGYHKPISSGDNFIGAGLDGHSGMDFKIQMYVYKQFFIGMSIGTSYFDVTEQELLGNYRNSRISESFYYFGYEFLPSDKLRLGLNTSIAGDGGFKNTGFSDSNIGDQRDSARLTRHGIYLNYEIGPSFMVYLDYGYTIANTNIRVPESISNFFSKGTYSSIGIGIVFTIGSRDLISRFIN